MEFGFSRKLKELGRLPPEVLTKVFTTSNRTGEDKAAFVLMLREFSNAAAAVDAGPDHTPTAAKARITAARKNIVSAMIGKMRRNLEDYERNHDRLDSWVIDFKIGEDYSNQPLQYLKDQHARYDSSK